MLASMSLRSVGIVRSRRSHTRDAALHFEPDTLGGQPALGSVFGIRLNQFEQAELRIELLGRPFELAEHPQ
jgi:hypothetical protein